jgi:hypothetical protein
MMAPAKKKTAAKKKPPPRKRNSPLAKEGEAPICFHDSKQRSRPVFFLQEAPILDHFT